MCPKGEESVTSRGCEHLVNGFGGAWDNPAAPRCGQTMPEPGTAGDKGKGMELLRGWGLPLIEGTGKDVVLHIAQGEESPSAALELCRRVLPQLWAQRAQQREAPCAAHPDMGVQDGEAKRAFQPSWVVGNSLPSPCPCPGSSE